MTINITLPLRLLKAIHSAAPKAGGLRPYLEGVHVRSTEQHVHIEAGDGHLLVRWTLEREQAETDAILALPKLSVKGKGALYIDGEGNATLATTGGESYTLQRIEGTYPDTDRVIPEWDNLSGEPAQFDPALLQRACTIIQECGKADGYKTPLAMQLHTNGARSAARITCHQLPQLTTVVMPITPPN